MTWTIKLQCRICGAEAIISWTGKIGELSSKSEALSKSHPCAKNNSGIWTVIDAKRMPAEG